MIKHLQEIHKTIVNVNKDIMMLDLNIKNAKNVQMTVLHVTTFIIVLNVKWVKIPLFVNVLKVINLINKLNNVKVKIK